MSRATLFRICSRIFVAVYSRAPIFGELRSSVAVIRRGQEFLLHRRNDGLGWDFPGGVAWAWESDEQALRREVWEEAGMKVRRAERLLVYSDRHYIPGRITAFAAEAEGTPRGSWEGEVAWLPLAAAAPNFFLPHTPILKYLAAHPLPVQPPPPDR